MKQRRKIEVKRSVRFETVRDVGEKTRFGANDAKASLGGFVAFSDPNSKLVTRGKGFKMPKMKTHKGVAKRFRVTANGKVKHRHSGTSHLAWRMTSKRVRNLRGTDPVATCEEKRLIKALGKGGY